MYEVLAGPLGEHVPVRGIASGTYHHNKPERTARYRIFEIDGGRLRGDHVRVWNRERGVFEPGTDTSVAPAVAAVGDGTLRQSNPGT